MRELDPLQTEVASVESLLFSLLADNRNSVRHHELSADEVFDVLKALYRNTSRAIRSGKPSDHVLNKFYALLEFLSQHRQALPSFLLMGINVDVIELYGTIQCAYEQPRGNADYLWHETLLPFLATARSHNVGSVLGDGRQDPYHRQKAIMRLLDSESLSLLDRLGDFLQQVFNTK